MWSLEWRRGCLASFFTFPNEFAMNRWNSLFIFLVMSPLAFGQGNATKRRVPVENAEISAAMQKFVDANEISGAVTLVAHKGEIVHLGAVGLSDIQGNIRMRKNALFAIASMTKPVVATGLMILQDEGKLSVDDKVSKYLPAFAKMKLHDGTLATREVTIRDCLTHTAGLVGNQIFAGSLSAAIDELADRPLGFDPGEKWRYSPGLNVAGRIIEVVSEQPLQEFLQARIFQPLGMKNTTFFPDELQRQRIATLYGPSEGESSLVAVDNRIADPANVKAPNPSGGLFSTACDMFRFYQMVLNGGTFGRHEVVSREAVLQMTSPQTGDLPTGFTPGNCWGLGWCIVRKPQDVTGMLSSGTFGHGGAFGTQGWVDPKTKTIYVLMIQRTKLPNSDASDIRKSFQQLAADSIAGDESP